jgi:hypothetical protein
MTAIVVAYDPTLHKEGSASRVRCAQGGPTCPSPPEFTVTGESFATIATCAGHLAGAVREAAGMQAVNS